MKKAVVLFISLFLLTSCNLKQGIQQKDVNQNCEANVIGKEQLADLLYSKNIKGVQFIDIRNPHQYAISHLPGAINIPMKNFFNEKYFSKINKDAVLILYGEDASAPRLMALMGGHFKKGFFHVALGGYPYIKNKIIDNYGIYSGLYNDEIPLVDFQQAINEIRSRAGGQIKTVKPKPAATVKPVIKRKKKEVTGGCG